MSTRALIASHRGKLGADTLGKTAATDTTNKHEIIEDIHVGEKYSYQVALEAQKRIGQNHATCMDVEKS